MKAPTRASTTSFRAAIGAAFAPAFDRGGISAMRAERAARTTAIVQTTARYPTCVERPTPSPRGINADGKTKSATVAVRYPARRRRPRSLRTAIFRIRTPHTRTCTPGVWLCSVNPTFTQLVAGPLSEGGFTILQLHNLLQPFGCRTCA